MSSIRPCFWIAILIPLIITACGPSNSQVATAIAQTQEALPSATPEPTATRIPLAELPLEGILLASGDLPPGIEGAQVVDGLPEGFANIPEPDRAITQYFQKDGLLAGGVNIAVYTSDRFSTTAWNMLSSRSEFSPVSDVGEQAAAWETSSDLVSGAALVFVRCGAVTQVSFAVIGSSPLDRVTTEHVTAYARRLDKRLQPLLCQE
jgi:hypothetical protein